MRTKKLDQMIVRLENFLECWKQFSHFLNQARFKKFSLEDESHFLETKSVITQELELILSSIEGVDWGSTRTDVLNLLSSAPSVRYLSEMSEASMRGIENQWHKLFIHWQSILGQMKVRQKELANQSVWASLMGMFN